MGVVNVTPDSFSDGGLFERSESAVAHGLQLLEQGATLLDVGGESSRPGAEPVSILEETQRVVPVIEALAKRVGDHQAISVDTCKPEVARAALEAGAHLVNDITGLQEPMLEVVAEFGSAGVAMHMQGEPRTMQQSPQYGDVLEEVRDYLGERLAAAQRYGVPCLLDPGIGFGKTLEQNLTLLANLDALRTLGAPLLVGVSRKSMLGQLTGADVDERVEASLGAHVMAALQGVEVLRVHDVLAHRRALAVVDAVQAARRPSAEPEQVHIDDLRVSCHIGVPEEERAVSQPLTISLVVTLAEPSEADSLETTIDYAEVCRACRTFAASSSWRLVETFAQELGRKLLETTGAAAIEVRIDKPEAAAHLGARSVGCSICLRADDTQ